MLWRGRHILSGHINDNIGMHNNNDNDVNYDKLEWHYIVRPHKKYSLYYEVKERVIMIIMMIIILSNINFISEFCTSNIILVFNNNKILLLIRGTIMLINQEQNRLFPDCTTVYADSSSNRWAFSEQYKTWNCSLCNICSLVLLPPY